MTPLIFRKQVAYAALLAAIVCAALWYRNSLISAGIERGEASVMALWAKDREKALKVAREAETARIASESAAAARNRELEKRHAEERAAAIADRDRYRSLFQRAREAASAASRGSNPEAASIPGTNAAPATGSPEATGAAAEYAAALDAAVADVMVESRQNASQLLRLQDEVRPQLR